MAKMNLRRVAERAGVSTATASYALRGLARVPAATRARVEAAAEALGYRPPPGLGRAMAAIRRGEQAALRHVFGVIGPEPLDGRAEGDKAWLRDLHAAVARHAERRGCGTEYFPLAGRGALAPGALSRVLAARGVRGLVVLPVPPERRRLKLEWRRFATVAVGFSLALPGVCRVASNTLAMAHEAARLLERRGARRIGLCLSREASLKYYRILEASFLLAQSRLPAARRVPVAVTDDAAELRAWRARWRPDGIIGNQTALRALEGETPEPERTVWLDLWPTQTRETGFIADFDGLGRAAVEAVFSLVEHGEVGPRERPPVTLVAPIFRAGAGR